MQGILLPKRCEIKLGYYQYEAKLFPRLSYVFYDHDAERLIQNFPEAELDKDIMGGLCMYTGQDLENKRLLYFAIGPYRDLFFDLIVLHFLEERYPSSTVDVVTHMDIFIFLQQFGFKGGWNRYPIPSDFLSRYDYIYTNEGLYKKAWNPRSRIMESVRSRLSGKVESLPMTFKPCRILSNGHSKGGAKRFKVGIFIHGEGPMSHYPLTRYKRLIELLESEDMETMLLGFPALAGELNGTASKNYICTYRSIHEMLSLLWQSDLIIASDSVAGRAGSVFNKPTIVISNTDDKAYPWGPSVEIVSTREACAPCYRTDSCPLGYGDCRAMHHESVSPEIIFKKAIRMIEKWPPQ